LEILALRQQLTVANRSSVRR